MKNLIRRTLNWAFAGALLLPALALALTVMLPLFDTHARAQQVLGSYNPEYIALIALAAIWGFPVGALAHIGCRALRWVYSAA